MFSYIPCRQRIAGLSQTSRSLRRGSAATRLLGFRDLIQPGARMSVVSVVCCLVEVPATGWSLVQRSPTDCDVSVCSREVSIMRRIWPTVGLKRHRVVYIRFHNFCFLSHTSNSLLITHFFYSTVHNDHLKASLDRETNYSKVRVKIKLSFARREGIRKSGGTAPRSLNLGSRQRWVASFTYRPLGSAERVSGTH